MNQLVVTLIIILLPGIIACVICDKITVHSKWTSFKFSLYALVLGIFSYVVLQLFYYLIDLSLSSSINDVEWTHLKIWEASVTENPIVPANEVIWASLLSIPVSFLVAFLINHKIFNKVSQFIGVSTKYGDENLFSYYLNAKEIDWIYIRDFENNLTYQGRIVIYSETDHMQEIVMSEVTVFRYEDSAELYSIPTIYLTKEIGKFVIEAIPKTLLGEGNDNEETY
jgi:hypothetical protein